MLIGEERRAEIEERCAKWKRQTFVAVLTEVCIIVWYAPTPKNTLLLGLGAVLDLACVGWYEWCI